MRCDESSSPLCLQLQPVRAQGEGHFLPASRCDWRQGPRCCCCRCCRRRRCCAAWPQPTSEPPAPERHAHPERLHFERQLQPQLCQTTTICPLTSHTSRWSPGRQACRRVPATSSVSEVARPPCRFMQYGRSAAQPPPPPAAAPLPSRLLHAQPLPSAWLPKRAPQTPAPQIQVWSCF